LGTVGVINHLPFCRQRQTKVLPTKLYPVDLHGSGHSKEWSSEPGLLLKTVLIAKIPFILMNGSPNQPFIP
jgi:hypothetical protein